MSSDQLTNRRPSEWILSIFRFKPWTDEDLSLSCWKPCGFARYLQLAMVPGQRFGFLTMTSPPVMGVKMENIKTLRILACDVGFIHWPQNEIDQTEWYNWRGREREREREGALFLLGDRLRMILWNFDMWLQPWTAILNEFFPISALVCQNNRQGYRLLDE